ncbi:hypothetical protein PanWU01x14_079880 [Parasponia andersonii]|uniref:Uncharacterized protein n=1 Tax=Parasponia andersonii TaxID=3476 RepID=A0A2P5DBE3_PARAD|nr:hypothetical protein PanWU01x14_079880 [Parasponia andersonii]
MDTINVEDYYEAKKTAKKSNQTQHSSLEIQLSSALHLGPTKRQNWAQMGQIRPHKPKPHSGHAFPNYPALVALLYPLLNDHM